MGWVDTLEFGLQCDNLEEREIQEGKGVVVALYWAALLADFVEKGGWKGSWMGRAYSHMGWGRRGKIMGGRDEVLW